MLDALGIGYTHLVVHDLGGPVGRYWINPRPHSRATFVVLNMLVHAEISWAVKLFLLALHTPGLRDYLVSPKGIVATMKLSMVNQGRLNREALTPYTAPFEDPAARKALIKAASALGTAGLTKIARELPRYQTSIRLIYGENDLVLPDIAKTMHRLQSDHPQAELTPPKKLRPLPPRRQTKKIGGPNLRVPQPAVKPTGRAASPSLIRREGKGARSEESKRESAARTPRQAIARQTPYGIGPLVRSSVAAKSYNDHDALMRSPEGSTVSIPNSPSR